MRSTQGKANESFSLRMPLLQSHDITKWSLEIGCQKITEAPNQTTHRQVKRLSYPLKSLVVVDSSRFSRTRPSMHQPSTVLQIFPTRSLHHSLTLSLNISFLPAFLNRISFLTKPLISSPLSASLLAAILSSLPILYRDSALPKVLAPACTLVGSSPTARGIYIPATFDDEPGAEKLESDEIVGDGVLSS